MAPNPRVLAAFKAMEVLGISEKQVKPVLKNLLKVYDKNWQLIEEESYRALADAIFEAEESKVYFLFSFFFEHSLSHFHTLSLRSSFVCLILIFFC